ncbi:hypothetical protein B0H19DRAFT_1144268 [Mycena capillaripes]|nr:hypothetical protein B0H19DRAFT_1144268 [Mycena capillaripes]
MHIINHTETDTDTAYTASLHAFIPSSSLSLSSISIFFLFSSLPFLHLYCTNPCIYFLFRAACFVLRTSVLRATHMYTYRPHSYCKVWSMGLSCFSFFCLASRP